MAKLQDIAEGGADLAGQAIRAWLVDELQVMLVPAIVGGKACAPSRRPLGSGTPGHAAVRVRCRLPQVRPQVTLRGIVI